MSALTLPSRGEAANGALRYERHRPEQTTLYRLVQQHAASFIAHTEASTGSELPRFIKDEFDAFLECGILAHGFL
ncbi:MAG: IS91 family transposase, partial [Betaproteobacteria bacterium]